MLGFLSFTWLGARGIYEPAVRCACSMLATLTHSSSCPGCFTYLQPSVVNNAMIDILAQTVSTSDIPTEMGVLGLGVCVYSVSLRRDKTAPIYDFLETDGAPHLFYQSPALGTIYRIILDTHCLPGSINNSGMWKIKKDQHFSGTLQFSKRFHLCSVSFMLKSCLSCLARCTQSKPSALHSCILKKCLAFVC